MTDLEKLKTWLKTEIENCEKHHRRCFDGCEKAENIGKMIGYQRAIWSINLLIDGEEI